VRSAVALTLACAAIALAVLPAAWVLLREAVRRLLTRRALGRVAQARGLMGGTPGDVAEVARALQGRFDPVTVDRAVVELLRSKEAPAREWGARLFAELGLASRYARVLRAASRWSERAHAAELLGLAAAPAAIPALVEALRDRDEDEASVKPAVAAALGRIRDPAAVPLLVQQLRDADDRSARALAEALVAFGPAAVPALTPVLGDPSQGAARVWAARILGRIGDPGAVDDLVARLHDRDDRLRMAAAEALGAIGDPKALAPMMRAALRDPAPQVRAHAAGAVAGIEGERAVDVLVNALADPDYATRLRALEAFETMQIEDTSPLETALRDPNVEVRRRAALALERVGYLDRVVGRLSQGDAPARSRAYAALLEVAHAGLVESVASYVRHPSFEVRAVVARACGEIGAVKVAPVLLRSVSDEAWPVRAAVCTALGRLRHAEALPSLVGALGDPEESVSEAAAEALLHFAPEKLAPHAAALAAAYDVGTVAVRSSVVAVAGRLGPGAAEALLVRASVDPSDIVRLSAVTALGQAGGDARIEPLVQRLTDASLDVRMAAVTALGSIDRVEAFEGLLRALPGADRAVRDRIAESLSRSARAWLFERLPELEARAALDVRLGVVWTLGKIADPAAIPALARFLRDADAGLRASSAGALAKIDHPAARTTLLGAIEDPEGRVRAAVVNALGRVAAGEPTVTAALELRARDPDPFVRSRAVIALARAGRKGKAPADRAELEARVRAHLGGAEGAARLVALALVGTESALSSVLDALAAGGGLAAVLAFLEREESSVRAAFFEALRLEDPARSEAGEASEIVVQYEKTLRSSLDVEARRLAAAAVERMGAIRAVPALVDAATGDPNETVRLRATIALASRASDEAARRGLVRAVADPHSEVAMVGARAVAGRREPDVIHGLHKRLGAGSVRVQEVVEAALAELHREDPTPFLDWMMGVDVPDLLTPAVRVLSRMGNPATLPLLRELLRSRSVSVRAAALRAIARIDAAEAAAAADAMAQDPSEDVRTAVVDALEWTPQALTRFAQLRRDPSVKVRAELARALGRPREATPATKSVHRALEAMLGDASPAVRAAALASLAASPDADGLRAFLTHWPQVTLETRAALRDEPRSVELRARLVMRLGSSSDPAERKAA
ncbi:MAG: HEAT repeat domain-containing protein, partial [Myxococcales bacterium]|nr:HEAT repeat domain-containing protein [Myxococcales bacterium]